MRQHADEPEDRAAHRGTSTLSGSDLDATLVELAREGDQAAFEALIRVHQDRLYAIALRMTGHVQDAQDVVQESLLHAWQALPRFRQDAAVLTWLIRIVINGCHNLRRRSVPVPSHPQEQPMDQPTVEEVVEARDRVGLVTAAIAELPFDQRAALVLHTFDGRSQAQVAALLGTTESAVKVRIHRARRALLDRLGEGR